MALQAVTFDGTEIPFFSTWDEAYPPVEVTGTTEAGTDQVLVIRNAKLEITAGGKLLPDAVAVIEQFRLLPSFVVVLSDNTEHVMRMRDFHKVRVAKSEDLEANGGIWSVSFSLLEF